MTDGHTEKVGFIGLGNMGGRMGRCILQNGQTLFGYDVNPEQLNIPGLQAAGSVGELVQTVDIVLLSLPSSAIIEKIVLGENGVFDHAREGQIVVDLSTARVSSSRAIHDALAGKGVSFLDAGISGGAKLAEKGELTLMVGGDAEGLERVRPILELFSSHIFHMGGSGSGHAAKILNNFLNGISLAATAEVMVAAKKTGLHLETFLNVVNNSSGVNFATINRFPFIIKGDYLEGGLTGELMAKDLHLYLELIKELGVVSFQGASCLNAFEVANGMGYRHEISNKVVDAIGDLAGGVRLHKEG
ncbi:MAG TPA: NAD(P)-dependent oxidoreductase [Bacillales bacterium]|nr:NAD(P)-dependent oxidoreductase [Bacillales bacterium]